MLASSGDDTILGGDGDEFELYGGPGNDMISGGNDNDVALYGVLDYEQFLATIC